MIIKEVDLDSFCKDEYLAFIETLLHYYYVQFKEVFILEKVDDND
jgi:hypothetical protein